MFYFTRLNALHKNIKTNSNFGNNKRLLQILEQDLDWQDKFSEQNPLVYKLDSLINEIILLLDRPINEVIEEVKQNDKLISKEGGGELLISDVNMLSINRHIDLKIIQALKLKMVIKPEFLINTHTHNVTKHQYAILRVLWLDNNLKKTRKYSTSLGNLDTFGSIENINPNIIKEEKKKLELKLQELYAEEYT